MSTSISEVLPRYGQNLDPDVKRRWLSALRSGDYDGFVEMSLAAMNDDLGMTFSEIADIVEKYL